jgi:uncharacterized membrane protein YhhN
VSAAVVLTALVVAFVCGLLLCEARDANRAALVCKSAASAGFVAVACALGALDRGAFGACVLVGLVLSATGDVALALQGHRSFLFGLVAFLLGHVAYIAASAAVVPVRQWLSPLAALPVVATTAAYVVLSSRLGALRGPVIAYMATITVMIMGAMAFGRADTLHGDEFLLGALLFYVSDLSVARDRFVRRAFVNRAWGLPAYYAGQLLLAWAARGG